MKFVFAIAFALAALAAEAKLKVVATLPDLGSIAAAVGGGQVAVTTIARGTEDPHFVDARPSFVRVLNQAEVLIEGGAELESGWLPPLVNAARNPKILAGAPGRLVVGQHIPLIDVPAAPVDRSMGDVHPAGNPHYWLDPNLSGTIAERIAETLGRIDPAHAQEYRQRAKTFGEEVRRQFEGWDERLAPFRGTKVITYHKTYDYFLRRFGLEVTGQLEPKPGIEPSATHMNQLAKRGRQEGVKLVIVEPFRSRRTADQVARSIGAKMVVLPDKIGATDRAKDTVSLFEQATSLIEEALKPAKADR
jgi:ABC-type Zn uptake system ZnuABC Zn-binding protein ZnuA